MNPCCSYCVELCSMISRMEECLENIKVRESIESRKDYVTLISEHTECVRNINCSDLLLDCEKRLRGAIHKGIYFHAYKHVAEFEPMLDSDLSSLFKRVNATGYQKKRLEDIPSRDGLILVLIYLYCWRFYHEMNRVPFFTHVLKDSIRCSTRFYPEDSYQQERLVTLHVTYGAELKLQDCLCTRPLSISVYQMAFWNMFSDSMRWKKDRLEYARRWMKRDRRLKVLLIECPIPLLLSYRELPKDDRVLAAILRECDEIHRVDFALALFQKDYCFALYRIYHRVASDLDSQDWLLEEVLLERDYYIDREVEYLEYFEDDHYKLTSLFDDLCNVIFSRSKDVLSVVPPDSIFDLVKVCKRVAPTPIDLVIIFSSVYNLWKRGRNDLPEPPAVVNDKIFLNIWHRVCRKIRESTALFTGFLSSLITNKPLWETMPETPKRQCNLHEDEEYVSIKIGRTGPVYRQGDSDNSLTYY
jgi:hypothetical protein